MNIWDLFKDILTSELGSFGTSFGLVIFFLWIAVKAGKIIERYKVLDKVVGKLGSNIDKTVDKIETNIGKVVGKLESNMDKTVGKLESNMDKTVGKLESNIDKIKEDISEIKAHINFSKRNDNSYAKSQSPISLNDKGELVAKKLQAKKTINNVWDKIVTEIDLNLSKEQESSPYTIQEVCFKVCESYPKYFTQEDMNHIKDVAFKEGTPLSAFDLLFGIEVRNRYFEENNIAITD